MYGQVKATIISALFYFTSSHQADHPLDEQGIEQALGLQSSLSQKCADSDLVFQVRSERVFSFADTFFVKSEIIFASPLTRALQTCLVAMHNLIAVKKKISILPCSREKKNLGSVLLLNSCQVNR